MALHHLSRIFGSTPARGVYLFALLGPPIGGLLFMGMMVLVDQDNSLDSTTITFGVFLFSVFSYVFGLVPAVATGLVAGLLRHHGYLRTIRQCFYLALMGGALTSAYMLTVSMDAKSTAFVVFMGILGSFSTFCCALLFRQPSHNPRSG